MKIILDCYTDEPAGLGVPNYLGTYPRYLAGLFNKQNEEYVYMTIDDFRYWYAKRHKKLPKKSLKTDIFVYNRTEHDVDDVLKQADELIAIVGVHVPGKYLTAVPGTLKEVQKLIGDVHIKKVLTGPARFGSGLHGGKWAEKPENMIFDEIRNYDFTFEEINDLAPRGADIIDHIPDERVIEIESGRGCRVAGCSFCTEPLKNKLEWRREPEILKEVKALYNHGARHFRVGKQACYFTHPDAVTLLKSIREACPDIETLHIDNVNPNMLLTTKGKEICKMVVEYGTPGNVAAFGVECWDEEVGRLNNLNTTPEKAYEAIRVINEIGGHRADNGMPHFLPGINIIFGLIGENKKTHEKNMEWLKKILDNNLMLRRINIRQVVILPGTQLEKEAGDKYLRKNKKYYWKWRNQIRQEIDNPMLKRVVPVGTVLKNVRAEIHDGNTTFLRQYGTYPLVIGVKERLPLKKWYDVEVTGHMLRSIKARVVEEVPSRSSSKDVPLPD